MVDFIWEKESWFNKFVYSLGWLNVLNLLFWIVIIIVRNLNYDKKFWNSKTYFVVYIFGWVIFTFLAFLLGAFILGLLVGFYEILIN